MELISKNLSKIYGTGENQVIALSKVNLTINDGEFISIIGPSGSGKSTLLHILSGLDKPTEGNIFIGGEDLYSQNDEELSKFRRRRFGFVFQQYNLIPILTAAENIELPIRFDKQKINVEYFEKICKLLSISDRLKHFPHQLSGGQQQRVAIARALIAQPEIIFADEPTGNLDQKSGQEVMELLIQLTKDMGKILVVITHDPKIADLADRKISIIDGLLTEAK